MSSTTESQVRNISNSEVTAFLSCKRQYDFAFIESLEPKETPHPLARGGLGHKAFEHYVKTRLNGESHASGLKAIAETFTVGMREGLWEIDVILQTKFLVDRYMQYHEGWPEWELLGSEERIDLPLTDTLAIPIRYDLYLKEKKTGKYRILDFKFSYNFWSPTDHELNAQMPKYVAVMQAQGYPVDGGYLEEIRSRPLGEEKSADHKNLWKRTPYTPSIAMKHNLLRQHVATSLLIEEHRALDPEERKKNVSIPVLNKFGACKYCNFTSLCKSMLEGKKDLSVDIRTDYAPNTYGYNEHLDNIVENI